MQRNRSATMASSCNQMYKISSHTHSRSEQSISRLVLSCRGVAWRTLAVHAIYIFKNLVFVKREIMRRSQQPRRQTIYDHWKHFFIGNMLHRHTPYVVRWLQSNAYTCSIAYTRCGHSLACIRTTTHPTMVHSAFALCTELVALCLDQNNSRNEWPNWKIVLTL